jgi:hypothetical protein
MRRHGDGSAIGDEVPPTHCRRAGIKPFAEIYPTTVLLPGNVSSLTCWTISTAKSTLPHRKPFRFNNQMIHTEVIGRVGEIRQEFQRAKPFRHVVIANFLEAVSCDALLCNFPVFGEKRRSLAVVRTITLAVKVSMCTSISTSTNRTCCTVASTCQFI